jgi:hypothetical protein
MNARDLLALYAVVGVACAIAVFHRSTTRDLGALMSALVTVPLWPLWAPFALAPARARRHESNAVVQRVERALADALDAVRDTPMSGVFTEATATHIAAEVAHVAARIDELAAVAERVGFDREGSAKRLEELENSGASERAIATARLQHASLERLEQLRENDARAIEELVDLLEALRTQLVLARYAGSPADGASAIVSEVWARLEGLGAVIDAS